MPKRHNSNSSVPDTKKQRQFSAETLDSHIEDSSGSDTEEDLKMADKGDVEKITLAQIDQKLEVLTTIKEDVKEIKDTIESLKISIQDTQLDVGDLKDKLAKQETKLDDLEAKVSKMEDLKLENKKLREDLEALEAYGRRENLIFLNIDEKSDEDCRVTLNNFLVSTGLKGRDENIMFQRVHRLGQAGKVPCRPIIARFVLYTDREKIWYNKTALKGTKYIIKEDFPASIDRRRSVLFPVMKRAKVLKRKATLRDDKLIVDGTTYTVNNVDIIANALGMTDISEASLEKHHLFSGQYSPLSNFARVPIIINDVQYQSTEHYFQAEKARFAGDLSTHKKIIAAELPIEAKSLGRTVKVDKTRWPPVARRIMEKAVTAKFTQNAKLRNHLLATGARQIVECSRDQVWGNGTAWNSPEAHDSSKWKGANQLGVILSEVRELLRER